MKFKYFLSITLIAAIMSCGNSSTEKSNATADNNQPSSKDFYFDYTIDGKEIHLTQDDILTTYNEFEDGKKIEFKIFAGKENGPQLLLTIPTNMSKPSTTPNGSPEPGNSISQGSVSLQAYPKKEFTFNSYDFLVNPKPAPKADAIIITNSEKLGDDARVITGTINTTVLGGENKSNDPDIKDRAIVGKFRIKHEFKGIKF